MSVLDDTKKKMNAAIEHLKVELKAIRTGRANPGMVEHVMVEVYGTAMRLQDVASISIPEPRQLLITPYDTSNLHAISKGIESANLNLQPLVDGNVVRIKVPEMDSSVREKMRVVARKKCEEAKVSIRNVRRESNDAVKKQKADGELPEDAMKKLEKQIQELTDSFCKNADDVTSSKEKEIATI